MSEKENKEEPAFIDPEEANDAAPLSEVEELRLELEQQVQSGKDAQERCLRIQAEFENYKKRSQKDQIEQTKYANERLIKETLPVIDNLERAIEHSKESRDFEKMLEGVDMIQKQFLDVLDKFGVKPIESLNQAFNPFFHQSVGYVDIEADSDVEENHVVNEAQKGYVINDRVLRPSLVLVGKEKAPSVDGKNEKNRTDTQGEKGPS